MCVLPIDHLLLSGVLETRREGEKEILYTHTHKTWKVNYLWAINYLSLSLVAAFWLCPPLSVDDDSDFVFLGGKWWWCRKKKMQQLIKKNGYTLPSLGLSLGVSDRALTGGETEALLSAALTCCCCCKICCCCCCCWWWWLIKSWPDKWSKCW